MTPEGRVKAGINALLKEYGGDVYYEMTVPGGYGKSGLDYTGCAGGMFFTIEAKRPGGRPTPRQLRVIEQVNRARGQYFFIDGPDGIATLRLWLDTMVASTCS